MESVEWKLWNGKCGMETVEWKMWNGSCGMETVEWKCGLETVKYGMEI